MNQEGAFGSNLQRAFRRFGIPHRLTDSDEKLVIEERRVHTSVYDQDKAKLGMLGPMTPSEEKLFRAGGFTAVIAARKFEAKESGDPTWREVGKSRYTVKAVEIKETKSVETTSGTRTGETIQQGTRPETVQRQAGQGKEPGASLQMPTPGLPGSDRQSPVAKKADEQERDTRLAQATGTVSKGGGTASTDSRPVRERQGEERSSLERTRPESRQEEQLPVGPELLSTVPAENPEGVGTRADQAMEATARPPVNKGGRPRLYDTDAERKRAYRERQRG